MFLAKKRFAKKWQQVVIFFKRLQNLSITIWLTFQLFVVSVKQQQCVMEREKEKEGERERETERNRCKEREGEKDNE